MDRKSSSGHIAIILMFKKEIIGIHIAENLVDICILTKKDDWYISETYRWDSASFKAGLEHLEKFLSEKSPSNNRLISVTIPQKDIFLRDVSLQNLTPEEAINSVKLGISLYAHLEPGEIYHDEWAIEEQNSVKIMIQYTKKSLVEPIIDIFKKTKHIKSLYALSSFFLGFDMLLRRYKTGFPCMFLLKPENLQDSAKNKNQLSMHGKESWLGIHSFKQDEAFENIRAYLPLELLESSFKNITLKNHAEYNKNRPLKDILNGIIEGKTAVSPGFCSTGLCFKKPNLSFYPQYKKKFLKPEKRFYIIFVILSAFIMSGLTIYDIYEYTNLRSAFFKEQNHLKQVEKNIEPLIQIEKQANELQKSYDEIQEFKTQRVSILEILKVLTEITPDHSFLRTFYYSDNKVRISVSGQSAIELMEIWRKNNKFSDVKLVSTVNKERENLETFSVEIMLSTLHTDLKNPSATIITQPHGMPLEY